VSEGSRNAADDGRPVVALPPSGPSLAAIILGCVALGLGLFLFIEGRRTRPPQPPAASQADNPGRLGPAAPPLVIPPAPVPQAPAPPPPPPPVVKYVERPGPPVVQYIERPAAGPPAPQLQARSPEPAMVLDLTAAEDQSQKGQDDAARAVVLHHRALVVAQGVIIPAVLETPIDSSSPGPVRAITSTDTYGFDGSRLLIPRGSRLYGQYQSDTRAGQARVTVSWTRLMRPDGISVRLNSPASDRAGQPGVPGRVNNHVAARLAAATLESALAVGVNLASRPADGSIVIGQPIQPLASAGATLIPAPPGPTIMVRAGSDISVFVARDLDFLGALPRL
jgi:type IV secretion system protein VirB10